MYCVGYTFVGSLAVEQKNRAHKIYAVAPHKFACSNAPNLKEAVNQNTSTSLLKFKTSSPGCGGSILQSRNLVGWRVENFMSAVFLFHNEAVSPLAKA